MSRWWCIICKQEVFKPEGYDFPPDHPDCKLIHDLNNLITGEQWPWSMEDFKRDGA